jgi:acetyl-CoA C-acetyltransferase
MAHQGLHNGLHKGLHKGFYGAFEDAWLLDGVRTPMIDLNGAFASLSPIDMGIKVAREVLRRTGIAAADVGSVVAGSMAQASFDAFMLARHIGLYAGVPIEVPALQAGRICGTGFELFRQAGDQIERGYTDLALCVGTESMSRNPIAAYTHRGGFRLGAPVEFKDFLWEALDDPACGISMIQTAENLAKKYHISRAAVDEFAAESFERALAARAAGFFAGETVPVTNERFELDGYLARGIELPRKIEAVSEDSHPRPSPFEALQRLKPVYPGGVQTAGNSSAVVDAAAAGLVASSARAKSWGQPPLAQLRAAVAVGVAPEIMGIGPAPAIRMLLERSSLRQDQIGLFEINEAQGAQTLAVTRELDLDLAKLNVHGGAIALGHPLAATGVRLTVSLARSLKSQNLRYGIASACVGGGQGMALLIENPAWRAH